jgi:glycogen(starch) synthase
MPLYRLPFWQACVSRDIRQVREVRWRLAAIKQAAPYDLIHLFHTGPGLFFHLRTPVEPAPPTVVSLHQTFDDELLQLHTLRGQLFRRADWIAACSPSVRATTCAQMPEIAGRCSVIPNSLPLPAVAPAPLPLEAPRLLCVGRVVPQKGFDVALRAFARVAGRYPQARLIIAGDGQAKPGLVALAESLGIAGAVDFLGWVAPPGVPALMNRCSLVVVPSRVEPFGLVALQAGQLARPVVASRVDGLTGVVVEGETGLLVEAENVEALAEALAYLLDHPETAHRLGQAARLRVEQEFGWEQYVSAYEALFQRLAENGHRGAAR